jgi:hypothetical protein
MKHDETPPVGAGTGPGQPPLASAAQVRSPAQVRADSRAAFQLHEATEMSAARRQLRQDMLRWAWRAAGPGAVLGWGLSYGLTPLSTHLSSSWARPGALTSLLLGAACGWLGAATVSLLVHSVFTEDRDIPVIVGGATALGGLVGGLYGAGFGSPVAMAPFIGLALPVGLVAGTAILVVYSSGRAAWTWASKEIRGS